MADSVATAPATPTTASGYNPLISIKKSQAGAIDGSIAAVITMIVIWAFNSKSIAVPEGMATVISSVAGLVVSAVVVAVKRYIGNWLKNKGITIPQVPEQPTEQPPTA
jgi:uncharacterized membrane-anchored protein